MKESKVKSVEIFLIFLYFNSFFTSSTIFNIKIKAYSSSICEYIFFTLTDHCEKHKRPQFDVMRILSRNHATTMKHERIFLSSATRNKKNKEMRELFILAMPMAS